jgi:hypothetical protein
LTACDANHRQTAGHRSSENLVTSRRLEERFIFLHDEVDVLAGGLFTVRPTHLAFPQEQQNPPNARRSRQADGNGHGTLDDG